MVIDAVAGKIDCHDGKAGQRRNLRQKLRKIDRFIGTQIERATCGLRMVESEQDARHHVTCIRYMHAERSAVFISREYMRRLSDIVRSQQVGDGCVSKTQLLANTRAQEKPRAGKETLLI